MAELNGNVLCLLRVHKMVYKRKITHTHIPSPLGKPTPSPWLLPWHSRRHTECPGWTPGTAGPRRQQYLRLVRLGWFLRASAKAMAPSSPILLPHILRAEARRRGELALTPCFLPGPVLAVSSLAGRGLGFVPGARPGKTPRQPLSEAAPGFTVTGKCRDRTGRSLGDRSPAGSRPIRDRHRRALSESCQRAWAHDCRRNAPAAKETGWQRPKREACGGADCQRPSDPPRAPRRS